MALTFIRMSSIGVISKHAVGWLPVLLVLQVTGTVATTINMTGIIFISSMNQSVIQLMRLWYLSHRLSVPGL